MRVNPQEFVSFPKEMVIGFAPATTPLQQLQDSLDGAGLAGDQIDLLNGEDGLELLINGGPSATRTQRLIRRIEHIAEEGLHLDGAVEHLKSGGTMVAVRRIKPDQAPGIRHALEMAGVGEHHYFGLRTFD